MDFINKTKEDKDYYHNDKLLLGLSNYVFNNLNRDQQSPHYQEIEEKIHAIAPDFFEVAHKFRPLATKSPALSHFDLQTKMALMEIVENYFEEIVDDGKEMVETKMEADQFDMDHFEEDFQARERAHPLSQTEQGLSDYEGRTDSESTFTDEELNELALGSSSSSATSFKKIEANSIESAVAPSKEMRENAIGLLIHYLDTYKDQQPEQNKDEYRMILQSIKMLVPTVLSQLKEGKTNIMDSLNPRQINNLYSIAGVHKDALNDFQEQLEASHHESNRFRQ